AEAGGMIIKPFQISHDCAEGLGYVIETPDNRKLAIATDTGYLSNEVKEALKGSDVVIIESNHDVNMLLNGSYPYMLKRRILSNIGHLSNETCSEFLPHLIRSGTTRLLLAHLSQENNMPQIALESARCCLQQKGMKESTDYTLDVAKEVTDGSCIIF
ncbi:MAG: MBL fold metallo-hydrolase, partial [Acutalibacteraceae bacterium]|nr:MBL fold metallo-hydrolase [Acutalibacteraceae bacterium]